MKKIITSIILSAIATITVYAQEQADTLKTQELNEVVVQAHMQRTSSAKSTYTPSGKQKNAAQNAVDLLRQMAIPQIRINPIDETVTDNVGGSVAIYINFLEASKEEMEGLRTADVRRVESVSYTHLTLPTNREV